MKGFYWFCAVITFSMCSYAQTNKVIDWPPVAPEKAYLNNDTGQRVDSNSRALEIVEIKVDGKSIVPGQPFSAGDDWLKNFAIKVRNISDKNILSIRLSFGLPETKSGDRQSGFTLEYGKELSTGIDYGVQAAIEPGQEVVLVRNDRHYARDKDGIAKRTGMTDFNTVIMGVGQAKFVDGTLWSSYKLPITATPMARN